MARDDNPAASTPLQLGIKVGNILEELLDTGGVNHNVSYFTEAALEHLIAGFAAIPAKTQALVEALISHPYLSISAKEYAQHGAGRRLFTLSRCIEQIYALLPPNIAEIPDRKTQEDASIFIQAFVFNAYGVLDNLAFIWVYEKQITKANGKPLPNGRVGITSDKQEVRNSFSPEMQAYLAERDPWFANLENFRHSLGHRIPLYIPPFCVDPSSFELYRDFDNRINDAWLRRDYAKIRQLKKEQNELAFFQPVMKQSLTDETPPIIFHAQVLADFATVEEISWRILKELGCQPRHVHNEHGVSDGVAGAARG